MNYPRLVSGPSGANVRMALASMLLSPERKPVEFEFTVNEGTDAEPNHVNRTFPVCGFHSYGGGGAAIALLLPIGAVEQPTRLIFYPEAPEGHVGHVETDEQPASQ